MFCLEILFLLKVWFCCKADPANVFSLDPLQSRSILIFPRRMIGALNPHTKYCSNTVNWSRNYGISNPVQFAFSTMLAAQPENRKFNSGCKLIFPVLISIFSLLTKQKTFLTCPFAYSTRNLFTYKPIFTLEH